MLTVRELDGKSDVKLIWWYIAAVDDDPNVGPAARTSDFTAQFFNFHEALQKLTFQNDRAILAYSIALIDSL